jgi:Cyclopropane fatty acid synthase and related methyltransferases
MNLLKFLNDLFKYDGFILIDANLRKFVIGKPFKENPIIIKLLDKNLNYKLLLYPDLYFGEAYTNGSLKIENGTLTEFLEIALRNIGRADINIYGKILNKLKGTYRYLTNFNKGINSKKNVSHHYDISEKLYDLFLDSNRQYSCAYFKNENDTLEEAQANKIDHIIKKLNIKPNQKV